MPCGLGELVYGSPTEIGFAGCMFHSSRPPKVRGAPFDPVYVLTTSVNLWNKYCKAELKNKETGTPRRARLAAKASERAATNE